MTLLDADLEASKLCIALSKLLLNDMTPRSKAGLGAP